MRKAREEAAAEIAWKRDREWILNDLAHYAASNAGSEETGRSIYFGGWAAHHAAARKLEEAEIVDATPAQAMQLLVEYGERPEEAERIAIEIATEQIAAVRAKLEGSHE